MQNVRKIVGCEVERFSTSVLENWVIPIVVVVHAYTAQATVSAEGCVVSKLHCRIISGDMLRDAQKHPENYRDLLVRVATYSAYFVELSPTLRNDIIARTEFQEI